jgi:hypothetical protein
MTELAQPSAWLQRFRHGPGRRPRVSFAVLVWQRPDEGKFQEALEIFEHGEGRLVDSYWCDTRPGGVALTEKKPSLFRRFIGRTSETRLHRMTEEVVRDEPDFARVLLEIDRYTIRVANVLSGMSRRIALFTLFALTRHILTFLEAVHDRTESARMNEQDPDRLELEENLLQGEREDALRVHEENLVWLRSYYQRAAARQAQIVYLAGMLVGFVALCVATVGLGFLFRAFAVPGVDLTLFIGCLVAGGIGAMMSVLLRMSSGKFSVNHEVGREYLTRLGSFRPAIGATFALVIYFALKGGLIPQVRLPSLELEPDRAFGFFLAVGFLVGFSERLAKEMLGQAESGLGGLGGPGGAGGGSGATASPSEALVPTPPPVAHSKRSPQARKRSRAKP